MADFDYDVKQKKNIAHGAFARKRGSKSKKCSLPSDLPTEAQKRKLNGPCDTVKLGEPMTWEEFKALPLSLAKEYIADLRDTYGVTLKMLAQMFGISVPFLGKTFRSLGLNTMFSKTRLPLEEIRIRQAKWDAFCSGVVGGGSNLIIEDANDQIEPENDEIETPAVGAAIGVGVVPESDLTDIRCDEAPKPEPKPTHATTNLCATFTGFPDLATLDQLYRLVGTDKVKVTINIEVAG